MENTNNKEYILSMVKKSGVDLQKAVGGNIYMSHFSPNQNQNQNWWNVFKIPFSVIAWRTNGFIIHINDSYSFFVG